MLKKRLLTFAMAFSVVCCTLFVPSASAEKNTVDDAYLGGLGTVSSAMEIGGHKYKYLKMTVQADSTSASYTVSFIGANSISAANSVSAINTSTRTFSGDSKYTIYILPRSGMDCPKGASYCFGAGSNYAATTLIQGNECNGKMCSVYGVRVNNKKIITGYNVDITYEFLN